VFIERTLAGAFVPRTNEPGRQVSSRLLDVLFTFRPGHSRLTLAVRTGSVNLRTVAPAVVTSGLAIPAGSAGGPVMACNAATYRFMDEIAEQYGIKNRALRRFNETLEGASRNSVRA
jgi:hypothetical protein